MSEFTILKFERESNFLRVTSSDVIAIVFGLIGVVGIVFTIAQYLIIKKERVSRDGNQYIIAIFFHSLIQILGQDQDVELGLLPRSNLPASDDMPTHQRSLSSSSIRSIDDDRHRVHRVIGDTLELFAEHLRAGQSLTARETVGSSVEAASY